ncbi:hypothetical protein [Pseudomonas agarici]|uniref:hypothetical protein n=1 Tax=Pseudomonas agarici TaxID=46677 RepID=UPI00036CADBF|nr:hypothetical protein [Pseudomonas agarici]NWB90262.1 hypothetical protein [Pseudomonas agarici]NWC08820.1 hypothetical protein [Pseudomonas agarici]SEK58745.1 hypothetical protein SAMN05216604_104153 [Pseudomonas agarici]
MSATNPDASDRLKDAISYSFDEPVTAYLTDAVLVAGCCMGVTHRHRKADCFGRFADGHRIRTSDVKHAEQRGPFWVLHTESGSFYVVASFDPEGGEQSLQEFLQLLHAGIHPTAQYLQ